MNRFYKFSLFLFLSIGLFACGVDKLSPCDGNPEMDGLLCKEYRYQEGTSIGYLSYLYNSDGQIIQTDYYSIEGTLKKFVTYQYENGQLAREASHNSDGDILRETTYNYNSDNSLSDINNNENGINKSRRVFEYQNTFLTKESQFSNEQLDSSITYQYFSDDGRLYKKSYYDSQNNLASYTTHQYFSNYKTRYNHYSSQHIFMGYDLEHFNADKTPQSFVSYGPLGEITGTIEYEYNELGQLSKSSTIDTDGKVVSHTLYMYY